MEPPQHQDQLKSLTWTTVGQALAEPHGRMYLAGEQTWVPFFGYMEGARQSGARAAREIIRLECSEARP